MNFVLESIRSIFQIDNDAVHGTNHDTYMYGTATSGLRYLILISSDKLGASLNQRVAQEYAARTSRPARWLARAAQIDLPSRTADSDKIDKTILVKISPGAAEVPMHDDPQNWEYVHLNDILARLVIRVPSLPAVANGHHWSQLQEPLAKLVKRNVMDFVRPTLDVLNYTPAVSSDAVSTLLDWVKSPGGRPFSVIFGLGGLGKTTLVEMVGRSLWDGFTRYEHSHIPAFVPLGGMPAGATYGLAAHISSFRMFREASVASVESLVRAGILVVFLDAFDEHLKFANRDDAVRFLRNLREHYGSGSSEESSSRLLLTSRDYYLNTDRLFDQELGSLAVHFRLLPFDADQRSQFIRIETRKLVESKKLSGFSDIRARQWAEVLEAQVQSLKAGQAGSDLDSLVGHSLFLQAFSEYITQPGENNRPALVPEDFRLHSVGLFDEVIGLINDREAVQKSRWDDSIYKDLAPTWQCSPFTSQRQNDFFSEVTKRLVLRDDLVPRATRIRPYFDLVESEVAEALGQARFIPEASSSVRERSVREQIERIAFNHIVAFFANHPLVASNGGGFDGNSLFGFRYDSYKDYFVKEYLKYRFRFLLSEMKSTFYGPVLSDDAALHLDELITELYTTGLLYRASNSLFFLCWDDKGLSSLSHALRALFVEPAKLGLKGDVFSLTLQYSLLFAKQYRELRGQRVTFEGLYLYPGVSEEMVMIGEEFTRLLNGITLRLCALGHYELSNVTLTECELLRLSVRHLGFSGSVTLNGGSLYLIPEEEDQPLEACLYVADGPACLHLNNVRVHRETLVALTRLAEIYPHFDLLIENVDVFVDEEEDRNGNLSPGRRFVNTLMRLMRKHDRPEFGVYSRKVLGRTGVPRVRENEALDVLLQTGIIGRSGDILIIKDPAFMYHPTGLYGRKWEDVEHMWSGLIDRIDSILGYDDEAHRAY